MKLTKMKRRLMGFSMIAAMGVSLFSAGADVLTVKAAEAEIPEEAVTATEEAATEETTVTEEVVTTSEEATETEISEETRVEAGADVAINETNFPDSTFREYVKKFDTDRNGSFSNTELQVVKEINVSGNYYEPGDIASFKGIEYFTALTSLSCGGNQLTSLDVSKNTALTKLSCGGNQLTSLDVSGCTALTELNCNGNQLTNLDVSKNTALTRLDCDYNQLTSLDVSKNTALTRLECGQNGLTGLDVSKNTALTSLHCGQNQLTSLDVSKNTALTFLACSQNQLTSLDVSKNTALEYLACPNNNKLTSLDVSGCTALTDLDCSADAYFGYSHLTNLDVSGCTALTRLACYGNELTSLDVSKNTALKYLYCHDNHIESGTLDVSNNKELDYLECDSDALPYVEICKDMNHISLHAPLYKKGGNSYIDLSEFSWDKTKISYFDCIQDRNYARKEVTVTDIANGYLTMTDDMILQASGGWPYTQIGYDFGNNEKKEIYIHLEETKLDSFAEYQGYYFYENKHGDKYCFDSNGNKVINEFKCDGTYTYFFQANGTAMRDRLTYHPDGVHIIYFDEEGHEVFSNFHAVKKSIEGNAVNDLCFFDVYGYMYVDVMTYGNAAFGNGDKIYYINPYGVIERNGWFGFSETCVWAGTDKKVGTGIGYANADGSLMINQHTYYNGNLVYMQGDGHMK